MKSLRLFIVFITLSSLTFAQTKLKGTIIDNDTKQPIVGATIYILEINKGVLTDSQGNYSISSIGKGIYKISVSNIGYQNLVKQLEITGDENEIKLDFKLQYQPYQIDEVILSSYYFNPEKSNPYKVASIKTSSMAQQGAVTIMDIIDKEPGVNAITTGPLVSRPTIRGLSGNRVLTLVDGVRFETQQWDSEHGIGVNELGVEHIEIIKGPSSLLYGPEAMGGIIRLVDEKPAEVGTLKANASGALYSNNLGAKVNGAIKGAKEDYYWSVNALGRLLSDYFYNGYSFRVPNTRLMEYGGKGKFGINRKWGSTNISYTFNKAYYGILDGKDIVTNENGQIVNVDSLEKEKFPFEIEAPFHNVTDNRLTSKTTILSGKSKIDMVFGYQNNHRSENEELEGSKKGYTYLDMVLKTSNYNINWTLPKWENFETILGVQGMFQKNKNKKGAATQLIPDASINDFAGLAITKYHSGNFTASAGIRFDNRTLKNNGSTVEALNKPNLKKQYQNISSSIGFLYKLSDELLLRTTYASGYRAPNLNELFSNGVKLESQRYEIGNIDFKKETNHQLDINAVFETKDISIEGSVFFNSISEYIYLAPTGNMVESNIDENEMVPEYKFMQSNAKIEGGEAEIDIHPSTLSWVHFDSKFSTLIGKRKDNDSYLPMMPATKLYNTLSFNFDHLKTIEHLFLNIGLETSMKQKQVALNEDETPSYTLLNASIGGTYHDMDFTLSANNIFDTKYLDHLSRFRSYEIVNPGVNVFLNVKVPILERHTMP